MPFSASEGNQSLASKRPFAHLSGQEGDGSRATQPGLGAVRAGLRSAGGVSKLTGVCGSSQLQILR